eukprot:4694086-Lingulodinium_polyedra.AAC.2
MGVAGGAEHVRFCLTVIPMGWLSAVAICQHLTRRWLHLERPRGAALPRDAEVRKDKVLPTGPDHRMADFYEQYIDNFDLGEIIQVPDPLDGQVDAGGAEDSHEWQGRVRDTYS